MVWTAGVSHWVAMGEGIVFGLDIDGTLTAMPDFFRPMCRAIMQAGGLVYLITGCKPGDGPARATNAGREAQVAQYGFRRGIEYAAIFICPGGTEDAIGKAKERVCKRMGVQLLIDNDPTFANDVAHAVPCALLLGLSARSDGLVKP